MIVKIYGERNTGTNYLIQLILKNMNVLERKWSAFKFFTLGSSDDFQCLGTQLGWKHKLVSPDFFQSLRIKKEEILFVTLTKNPYSWLLSLYKRPYAPIHLRSKVIVRDASGKPRPNSLFNKCGIRVMRYLGRHARFFFNIFPQWSEYESLGFSDFIRVKWHSEFQEGKDEGFRNAIELWNEKNRAYLELAKHYDVILLTYEELLASPEVALRKITNKLSYSLDEFKNIATAAKKEDMDKNHDYYKDYYLQERWREKLNKEDIAWISSQLNPEVMRAFGYKLL